MNFDSNNIDIYVVQPFGLGDFVCSEPISRYLKTKYPNSIIHWVSTKNTKELLENNPNVDKIIEIETFFEFKKSYEDLFSKKPHLLFDLTGLLINLNKDINLLLNYFFYGSLTEAFSLMGGLPRICEQPNIYITDFHKQKIDKIYIPENSIAINRFSNISTKDLTIEKWDLILKHISDNYSYYTIIEIGGKDTMLKQKPHLSKKKYIDLRGQLSILESAEVIRRCRYFIGVDSGPAHLANAVMTKGVIILGEYMKRYKNYIPYCGFYRNKNNVRYARNINGLAEDIDVNKVISAFESLFNNTHYNQDINPYNEVESIKFNNFIKNNDDFIIWGASNLGLSMLRLFRKLNKNVVCFVDSDVKKDGIFLKNIPVYYYAKLNRYKENKIIISTSWWQDVSDMLENNFGKEFLKDYI
jgi:ADP-heptose:LPS heptosyltransferase